ncbi:FAD-binding protein [Pseudodesulfovibrio sp. F-1]|uniref:FAD-binding protein n=1 Tax=Pseudodesulfovibrio alkaliphilus TaxID=2661613 RepID=A0A7K1KPE2_9BACT|nr:FAD-linked oxidase C-terminal domain-containing protein [Pseudodesulfovibrio alkaliphilus]MUM77772.1 FAD-binding protein [Pseudodesulfovibrio alkaliphilus]
MIGYATSLTAARRAFLLDLFPGDGCLLSTEGLAAFSADASRERAMPWAVVRPERREQLVELLRWAEAERMPVYPRARGTGRVGGAVPSCGGVVVSMLRMTGEPVVDADDFVAEVLPGVITADLQAACSAKGLFYPPDPASVRISTIGGNVATCAGGLRAVKYGVTRDWVLGVEAVLPGGRVLRTGGRSHKDVVGLDLTRLFVGSNGRLGLMTRITLKLIPLPETSASALVGFADLASSLAGAGAVFRAGVLPSACEFMDQGALEALRLDPEGAYMPVGPEAQAALLFKLDGSGPGVAAEMDRLTAALAPLGPVSVEIGRGQSEEMIWNVRRGVSPAAFRLAPDKLAEDIAVPRGRVAEAVERTREIGVAHGLRVLSFGHLGDGNIHINIMHDRSRPGEAAAAASAADEIFRLAVRLGGTISGEHGTGLTKATFADVQLGPDAVAVMRDVRRVFDPHEIMNPGKGW